MQQKLLGSWPKQTHCSSTSIVSRIPSARSPRTARACRPGGRSPPRRTAPPERRCSLRANKNTCVAVALVARTLREQQLDPLELKPRPLLTDRAQLGQRVARHPEDHPHARLNHPLTVEMARRTGKGQLLEEGLKDSVDEGLPLHWYDRYRCLCLLLLMRGEEEEEGLPFPYRHVENLMHFEETIDDPSLFLKKRPDVELYIRFPWLEFKNSNLRKRYEYRGRDTESNAPFFVRFTLSQEVEKRDEGLFPRGDINGTLKKMVEGVVSPQNCSGEKQWEHTILKLNQIPVNLTLFNNQILHHGYLLTGIARPSTTVNDAFDALFPILPAGQAQSPSENSASDIVPIRSTPNHLKLSWEFKWHSYQYLFFMSRAYQHFHQIFAEQMHAEEVEEAVGRELFNYNMSATLKFMDRNHEEQLMQEREYFDFFTEFLSKHHKHILQQMGEDKEPRDMVLVLEEGGRVYRHRVLPFDFKSYLKRKFQGIQIPQESLSRMVSHNRKRQTQILLTFPLKTRHERITQLKKLANNNKEAFNRIELLPLNDLRQHSSPGEEDRHFLILVRREGVTEDPTCTLGEIVQRCIARGQAEPALRAQDVKIRLFQDIYMQETKMTEYPLLKHFSCDPQGLVLEDGLLVPSLERLITKALQLDRLPLTQEQELLVCTPKQEMNVYQKLQELVQQYEQQLRLGALQELCSVLSDEQCTFQPCDPSEQVRIEQQPYGFPRESESSALKMKLLQVSMIDFQLANCRRCLYASKNEEKMVPFSIYTPQHYKQLRKTLALLLIQTNITAHIKCSNPHAPQEDVNAAAIADLAKRYRQNWKEFKRCIIENSNRRYFRQSDQTAFRNNIETFFKDIDKAQTATALREASRVAHKAHLIMECLKARLITIHNGDSRERTMEGLITVLPSMEELIKERQSRSEVIDRYRLQNNTTFSKQLKEGLWFINKELQQCKDFLQKYPSNMQTSSAQQSLKIKQKIDKTVRYTLIWLCSIFPDLFKYQQTQQDLQLYRIMMAFCCQLPQFDRNQTLQIRSNPQEMTNERLLDKIYKLKNVLLTELVGLVKERQFPKTQ